VTDHRSSKTGAQAPVFICEINPESLIRQVVFAKGTKASIPQPFERVIMSQLRFPG
jgi:hypothetical protein